MGLRTSVLNCLWTSVNRLPDMPRSSSSKEKNIRSNGSDEASLELSYHTHQPMDSATAGKILREAKQIFDQNSVTFFLRQGTCLGAIRENGFIAWDDDLDLGSVIGLHGFTENQMEPITSAFKRGGYYTKLEDFQDYVSATMMKSNIRIDWMCYRIVDDNIIHYPGVPIAVHLVTRLKKIDFAGESFLVPNPPEDYLSAKYGPDWLIPKSSGYEKDILAKIPDHLTEQKQFISGEYSESSSIKVRILDIHGESVHGALVRIAGQGSKKTNKQGYAKFGLPEDNWYSLVINFDMHEEVLYQERLACGRTYVYRPDPSRTSGRFLVLSQE